MSNITVAGRTRPQENRGVTLIEAPTLDALANTIRHEIDLTQRAATRALEHALTAGEALSEAKARVPRGKWESWLDEHHIAKGPASVYMRIATFREALLDGGATTLRDARKILRDQGLTFVVKYGPELTYEIKRLRDGGLSQREVARKLGVSERTVSSRMRDPDKGTRQVGGHNRKLFEITDEMIEGLAVWLAKRERRQLNDVLRGEALDALQAATRGQAPPAGR